MELKLVIYRIRTWLRHCLTATNTGGHGIHSPYLFEWVRMVMSDKHWFYVWDEIEAIRAKMLCDTREIDYVDYGSGAKVHGSVSKRSVCDVARGSLAAAKYGQLLSRLVVWLGRCSSEGVNVLELGTSLGVTTAYMAAMDSRNRVVTLEGCPAVAEIAKENWKSLGLNNIDCRVGEIDVDSLRSVIDGLQGDFDVVFMDANHTYAGTRAYFKVLVEKMHGKSVLVVDDIHHNEEMEKAWKEICADKRVSSTMDLYQMGLVFFDKHYWKRHYRIRL